MENIKISIDTDKIPTLKISKENYKKFDKILNMEEDELEYFKTKMTLKQQFNAINELQKLKSQINIDKPYLIYLTELDIPDIFKASALKKINIMKQMSESNSNEYYKLKMWVDTFIKIPFNKLSISYNNSTFTLNPIIIENDLNIGGATASLFPANYLQGVTRAQAILNYNLSISFAYLVEFDGTNTTYKSIRINSSNEVVEMTNGTAVITSDEEMLVFLTAQIEGSIAVLPE